jgi:predicted DNA binding CopG/RHH family protein
MERQRVTIRLPRALVERALLTAARRGISLSRVIAEALEQQVVRDEGYEAAWRR